MNKLTIQKLQRVDFESNVDRLFNIKLIISCVCFEIKLQQLSNLRFHPGLFLFRRGRAEVKVGQLLCPDILIVARPHSGLPQPTD